MVLHAASLQACLSSSCHPDDVSCASPPADTSLLVPRLRGIGSLKWAPMPTMFAPGLKSHAKAAKVMSFLDASAAVDGAEANADVSSTAEEAVTVLDEAKNTMLIAQRAARTAWIAVFVAGATAIIDLFAIRLDFNAVLRSQSDLQNQEEELEATGWPSWLHQSSRTARD
eukprot:TRINITY_DN19493_c0_g1_i4.p1 TRINITY_DN19493_c0_g1~~TRINITY_DN19493_c0_g1_i4.p1  ORF type:complete len:178 (+),score=30.43 TRINITY_DN19493_c0_g1_i4:26-535(+)